MNAIRMGLLNSSRVTARFRAVYRKWAKHYERLPVDGLNHGQKRENVFETRVIDYQAVGPLTLS
jgi:hypothetical protein